MAQEAAPVTADPAPIVADEPVTIEPLPVPEATPDTLAPTRIHDRRASDDPRHADRSAGPRHRRSGGPCTGTPSAPHRRSGRRRPGCACRAGQEAAAPADPAMVAPLPEPAVAAPVAPTSDSVIDSDMLPIAGAAGLGILALAGAGFAMRRRRRSR